ncbi:hypothetical protein B0H10DRAFT_2231490 [Mycena sp. CBHHK59/15]|nr:hypothetical protein B0H10DRAFT_2231490 [Mycena sp. CBHHK59/15]
MAELSLELIITRTPGPYPRLTSVEPAPTCTPVSAPAASARPTRPYPLQPPARAHATRLFAHVWRRHPRGADATSHDDHDLLPSYSLGLHTVDGVHAFAPLYPLSPPFRRGAIAIRPPVARVAVAVLPNAALPLVSSTKANTVSGNHRVLDSNSTHNVTTPPNGVLWHGYTGCSVYDEISPVSAIPVLIIISTSTEPPRYSQSYTRCAPAPTRQVELHGGPITVPLRSTPRRILAVLPPSSPSPRKAAMPLTDGVFEVARRGHSDFLLYCHIPIDARRPPPPPPPSAFPPTIGRSRNAQIAGCPRTPLHRFRDDTGEPCLAAHAPVIPPIEVLPRVTPTLDPRPNATRGKSTCTRVDSPYLLARCFDEARPSHRSHLRALATPSWDSYGASPLDCPIAIHAVSSDPSTPPYTFSPTAARSRGAEIASCGVRPTPSQPSVFCRVCVQLNRTRRRHALTLVDPARIFPGLDARLACTQPHHANFQNLFAPSTSSHSMSTLPAAGSCERALPIALPLSSLPSPLPRLASLGRTPQGTARGQTQARVRRGTTSTPPWSDICVAGDADVAHWKYELRRAVVVGSGKKEWGGLNMPAVADARSRPPLPCTFPLSSPSTTAVCSCLDAQFDPFLTARCYFTYSLAALLCNNGLSAQHCYYEGFLNCTVA